MRLKCITFAVNRIYVKRLLSLVLTTTADPDLTASTVTISFSASYLHSLSHISSVGFIHLNFSWVTCFRVMRGSRGGDRGSGPPLEFENFTLKR